MFDARQFATVNLKLDQINAKLDKILLGEQTMALDITALQTAVAQETTVDSAVETLLTSLSGELQTLIANSGNTVDPAALQAIVNTMTANATTLQAAVSANTPAAPASAALAASPAVAAIPAKS
jgi:hypothetical protein